MMKRFAGAVTFPFENDKTLLVSIIGGKMQRKDTQGFRHLQQDLRKNPA